MMLHRHFDQPHDEPERPVKEEEPKAEGTVRKETEKPRRGKKAGK